MKKIIISTLILFVFAYISCDKTQDEAAFGIKNFNHGECKGKTLKAAYKEYLEYSFQSDNSLKISHFNTEFNCCPGKFSVESKISNDTLNIYEKEEKQDCKCTCPYDFHYSVGSMPLQRYLIRLYKNDKLHFQFYLNFDRYTKGTQNIK